MTESTATVIHYISIIITKCSRTVCTKMKAKYSHSIVTVSTW